MRVIAKEFDMDERELVRLMERALGPNEKEMKSLPHAPEKHRLKRLLVIVIGVALLTLMLAGGLALCTSDKKADSESQTASSMQSGMPG